MNKARQFWDRAAGNYDKTEERFEYIHRTSRENAKKSLRNSDVVLDYGCGTGTTACALASHVKKIQAIDISTRMIELAKEKAVADGIENVDFAQVDIFDERFNRESFDAILAFNILHTIPNPQSAVRRIHELLKPDGLFISVTPCLLDRISFLVNAQIQLVRMLQTIGIIPIPIRRLASVELDELMLGGNFQVANAASIFKGATSYFMVAKKPSGDLSQ